MIINKKGDVPVVILVIGIIAICGLAILSFIVSDKMNKSDFAGVNVFEQVHSDVEKFEFYMNAGVSKEEAAKNINAKVEGDFLLIENLEDPSGVVKIVRYEYRGE